MADPPIVAYRRAGGVAGINQELRVLEDGRVELHDRRRRKRSELSLDQDELGRLRTALDAVPAAAWKRPSLLAMRRILPGGVADSMRVEIRHGGRALDPSADTGELTGLLDELLARAVRERPGR